MSEDRGDAPSEAGPEQELLLLHVSDVPFGVAVRSLCEVIDLVEITRLEGGEVGLAEGIINYRGTVIPVVDARRALGFKPAHRGLRGNIVITDVAGQRTGLVVDDVANVRRIPDAAIEPPGTRVPLRNFVSAIAKLEDGLLLILDLDRVLAQDVAPPRLPLAPDEPDGDPARREHVRRILHQRAVELSRPVEKAGSRAGDLVTFVRFALGDSPYAIRAEHTREIVTLPPVTPIPCTAPYVLGAVNIRGALRPVVRRGRFLHVQEAAEPAAADVRIVVAEASGVVVGLRVDSVLGICEVRAADIQPPLATNEEHIGGFLEGEFDWDATAVCAVSAPALIGVLEGG
ncbi:MAG: chemotaxis protein CheW [Deltaproteobacteria bacterium]|nr:chemotaxis protein CheW [Deltaproteobacteria bacterium]